KLAKRSKTRPMRLRTRSPPPPTTTRTRSHNGCGTLNEERAEPKLRPFALCRGFVARAVEQEIVAVERHDHAIAILHPPPANEARERILDILLDHALQRARAPRRIVPTLGQFIFCAAIQLHGDAARREQLLEPLELDIHDRAHLCAL